MPSSIRRIGLDIDGVLADFVYAFTQHAKRIGASEGPVYTTRFQQVWDFDFDTSATWKSLKQTFNWWMTVPPLVSAGEIEAINQVLRNHQVYFITTRPSTLGFHADQQARLWLQSTGITPHLMPVEQVIATKGGTKGTVASGLGIEVFLDDHVDNLNDLKAAGVKAVCRDWPYNQDWDGPRVSRIHDFFKEEGLL